MSAMNTPVSRRDENFAKKLQLECPNFCGFVMEKVNGKRLSTYVLKEKGDGAVSVILTYHVVKNKDQPLSRHLENKSSFTKNQPVSQKCDPAAVPNRKKKSPSRRRRDKAWFREFLEKKKFLKNRKTNLGTKTELSPQNDVSIADSTVQSTPPSDVEIAHEVPDTVTITAQVPQEPATIVETDPVTVRESDPAVSSPAKSCICSVCQPFIDKDLLLQYYATCDNYDTPIGCPRLHLNQVTKLPICPTELHRAKINQNIFRRLTSKKVLVDFGPIELNWANGQLCHLI